MKQKCERLVAFNAKCCKLQKHMEKKNLGTHA